ncbi:hypothetical protein JB92DRAFT_3085742 [Gautieria morchelliformis]|nr:hypothetical protein JB92DRAFT_3085742 [Gautieria morchelliformis]
MGKLHLKETPEERAERKWRKRRRAERKAANHHSHTTQEGASQWRRGDGDGHREEDEEGWMPPEGSMKIDAEQLRAEVEERLFREKLFDAMEDDHVHRLDGVEARLNDYAHVPDRWKTHTHVDGRDLSDHLDPQQMPDEEYTEWIREAMWRRTHKAEIQERERKKAERKARKEKQRKAREETARLERQREAERKVVGELKERRRKREAWDYYEALWTKHTNAKPPAKPLKFRDIPWPVFAVPSTTEDLTTERISVFLLYGLDGEAGRTETGETQTRKGRIREALLRWHPDKFVGKMGARLDAREREMVLAGVGIVARCLNELMAT